MRLTWRKAAARPRMQLLGLIATLCLGSACVSAADPLRSVVFYYGDAENIPELRAFQLAVVEPTSGFSPAKVQPAQKATSSTDWFAYVSVSEVTPYLDYYFDIPNSWRIGVNDAWQADIVDTRITEWPDFLVQNVISPLWDRGYTGFFLDTLDSYELLSLNDYDRRRSQEGLIRVIRAIKQAYPDARLIMNRGFELLPAVHEDVYAVAFESLFRGWDEATKSYVEVPEDDRSWLINQVRRVQDRYQLPVIAIDYCDPAQAECARETVEKIRSLGIIPYVSDGHLNTVNRSALE